MDVSPDAVEWLANAGYQPEFGARPLRRAIRAKVDRKLSGMLLSGDLTAGDKVDIDAHDGRLEFTVHPRDEVAGQRQGAGEAERTAAASTGGSTGGSTGAAGEGVPSDPGDEGRHRF